MNQATEALNEKTGELVPAVDARDRSLVFGTQEPERIIQRAAQVAERLTDIIEKSKLYVNIEGRKYVKAEGWSAMIAMLGIFPTSVWCNRLDRTKDEITYDAKVVLKHLSGTVVGEGQAIASNQETVKTRDGRVIPKPWARDEFSIKSMAQTRAVGKACRLSFSWIMALANYEPTPYEEMDGVVNATVVMQPKPTIEPMKESIPPTPEEIDAADEVLSDADVEAPIPDHPMKPEIPFSDPPPGAQVKKISQKQQALLFVKAKQANIPEKIMKAHLREVYDVSQSADLPWQSMDPLLKWIDKYAALAK